LAGIGIKNIAIAARRAACCFAIDEMLNVTHESPSRPALIQPKLTGQRQRFQYNFG
jgi:hypothetical protein